MHYLISRGIRRRLGKELRENHWKPCGNHAITRKAESEFSTVVQRYRSDSRSHFKFKIPFTSLEGNLALEAQNHEWITPELRGREIYAIRSHDQMRIRSRLWGLRLRFRDDFIRLGIFLAPLALAMLCINRDVLSQAKDIICVQI